MKILGKIYILQFSNRACSAPRQQGRKLSCYTATFLEGTYIWPFLTFRGQFIVVYSYNKTKQMH